MIYPQLGQTEQPGPDPAAYGELLAALRDKMRDNWAGTQVAYLTLKGVREQLGLPFIDDSAGTPEQGSAAAHGAWTSDLETQVQQLHAMSALIVNVLGDAVDGKRKVFYNAEGNLAIEQLPTDIVVLTQDANGVPELVGGPAADSPGQPVSVQAPIGVGVPALVWVATLTTSVLALPAYFIVDAAVNSLTDVAEQKTVKTIAEKSYDCVKSGNCTPDQAVAINKSVYDGAAGIRLAKAKEEEAKKPTDWTEVIKAASWLVGISLVGYAAIKILSALPAASAHPRLAAARAA